MLLLCDRLKSRSSSPSSLTSKLTCARLFECLFSYHGTAHQVCLHSPSLHIFPLQKRSHLQPHVHDCSHSLYVVSSLNGRDGSYNTVAVFPGSGGARADFESTWAHRREFLVKLGKEPDFMADDECSRLHLGCSATKWIAAS
jgi:hypothetical protein